MNKWLKGFLIFIAVAFILLLAARFTGALMWYKLPTPSNEPTLKTGQSVFASSLKQPKRGDFIVHTNAYTDSITSIIFEEKRHGDLYIKRLCGMPGDIIEMKEGFLYVNNKNFDLKLNLNHYYYVPAKQLSLIEANDINSEDETMNRSINDSTNLILFSTTLFNKYKTRLNLIKYYASDTTIWNNMGSNKWTIDNFGPITVPENCYFILGDNRNNSLDSRYFGFIKKSDWKATVLQK